jgi:uncharacterized protein YggE
MIKERLITAILSPVIFFTLLFAYVKLAGPLPFIIQSTTTTQNNAFSVTGEGKVQATPDKATVTAGVQAKGATTQEAQNQMNAVINKVSAGIKGVGIDSKDIKTENYNINPTYDYTNGAQRITGYSGSTNLTITVRDINKVNTVIDTATANGANVVSGAQFDVADKTKALDEARKLAVEDAKKKAQQAAQTAGFKLGSIVNYQESENGEVRPLMYAADKASAQVANPPTQVEPGSNQVVLTVTLSYQVW